MSEVFTHPSRYIVTVLPGEYESYQDWYLFVVTVQYRGRGKWAIYQGAYESNSLPSALSSSGEWGYEGSQEREDDAWLAQHRFDLETALALAEHAAPTVGIYDHRHARYITAAEVAAKENNGTE